MSGLTRLLPSAVTGPRLLNMARSPHLSIAPTLNPSPYRAGGESTLPQRGPSLPDETTTNTPAARSALTAGARTLASQPSTGGHPQESFITWARRAGSPAANASAPRG